MEVYVVENTAGIYYESEYSCVEGVYSSLEEAKRQANRYLSIIAKDEDIPQFDINDDSLTITYKPMHGDYGWISIFKCVLDEELGIEED